MPRTTGRPRFYFSFRSPYSWLAYRDLMDKYAALADAIEWRPFWEPDPQLLADSGGHFPYVAMSREKHLYVLQDVDRLRRARGLQMTWPVDRDPIWEVPHMAYLAATDADCGPRFVDRVYRVRWEEGRDICLRATIAELAIELGLSGELLANAADDADLRERAVSALRAIAGDGVFGVPFFVHGFNKFWGVDRLDAFVLSVKDSVVGGPAEHWRPGDVDLAPDDSVGESLRRGGDQGHAGGCG